MTVYVATDHTGLALKDTLVHFLQEKGYTVEDCGAYAYNAADDYPDFIIPAAEKVAAAPDSMGIIIGGSGQGEAIAANKVLGIRAAVFYGTQSPNTAADAAGRESKDPYELIRLSRLHNNANILSLAARFITEDEAKSAVDLWLTTAFQNDDRHQRRIDKIQKYVRSR